MKIEAYKTAEEALRSMTGTLISVIKKSKSKHFHIALSGGSTAQQLFKLWVKEYRNDIPWDILRFYWVDERCVSPEDDESNFKHADRLLFMPLDIPQDHIHRIWGEQEPKVEAERYSEMVKWELPGYSNMPRFDCTILGIGADGHVASIFNDSMDLLTDPRVYAVSQHPKTGQQRITMTGTAILKSSAILIPVIGADKQEIMEHLIHKQGVYPASYILSRSSTATLFTDRIIE